jgi:hypothetical protein
VEPVVFVPKDITAPEIEQFIYKCFVTRLSQNWKQEEVTVNQQ